MIAKVLICTHKQWEMRSDDIYTPIHVGKALSNLDLGIIGDDTGDNISKKNPNYCELTAQYWAWKNLKCDYIGLEHYRRHFDFNFTEKNIEKLMKGVDVVLPKPTYSVLDVKGLFERWITYEDLIIFYKVLKKKGTDMNVVDRYLLRNRHFRCNMFFMRKDLFDEFAQWEFDILSECEKYIRLSPYSRLRRIYGYYGEMLLPIWFLSKKLSFKIVPMLPPAGDWNEWTQKQKTHFRLVQTFNRYFIGAVYKLLRRKVNLFSSALTGLKQDGIEIE